MKATINAKHFTSYKLWVLVSVIFPTLLFASTLIAYLAHLEKNVPLCWIPWTTLYIFELSDTLPLIWHLWRNISISILGENTTFRVNFHPSSRLCLHSQVNPETLQRAPSVRVNLNIILARKDFSPIWINTMLFLVGGLCKLDQNGQFRPPVCSVTKKMTLHGYFFFKSLS